MTDETNAEATSGAGPVRRKPSNVVKRGQYWHVEIMMDGRKHRYTTGTTSRKEAVKIAEIKKRDLAAVRSRGMSGLPADMSFDEAALRYWEKVEKTLRNRGHRSSRDQSRSLLKRAVIAVGPTTKCSQMDLPFFWRLRSSLLQERPQQNAGEAREAEGTLAPQTVNNIISKVFTVLHVAEKCCSGRLPVPDPSVDDIYLPVSPRGRYLKGNEEALLLARCEDDLKDMLVFDLETGLRANELCELRWSEVDWIEESITVPVKAKGHTDRTHTVFLSQIALEILTKRQSPMLNDEFVFTHRCRRHYWMDGRLVQEGTHLPARYALLQRRFSEAREEAGIPDLIIHDLRRTAARRLWLDAGLEIAQAFLGHRSRQTTLRYLCITEADTKAAIRHRSKLAERRRAEVRAAIEAGSPVPEFDDRRIERLRQEFARMKRVRSDTLGLAAAA